MYLSDSWIYDCETSHWSWFNTKTTQVGWQLPALHSAASCLYGSRLYAFGGITQKGQHLKGLMELDLENGEWTARVDEQGPASRWGASLVSYKDQLYLFGGFGDTFYNDLWKFHPSNNGNGATHSGLNSPNQNNNPNQPDGMFILFIRLFEILPNRTITGFLYLKSSPNPVGFLASPPLSLPSSHSCQCYRSA